MVVLGLLLVAAGVIAILAALFSSSGTASFLGADLSSRTIFMLGLASGIAILWGFAISRVGVQRSFRHRREGRQLRKLSERNAAAPTGEHREGADDSGA
jgi:small-conductance mechanosensitive channel